MKLFGDFGLLPFRKLMCFVDKIRLVVDSDKELSRRAGRVYLYLVFFFYKINKKLLISFEVNWWISAFGWMGRSLRGQEGSQVGRLHEQWYILSCCWVANQKTCVYTLLAFPVTVTSWVTLPPTVQDWVMEKETKRFSKLFWLRSVTSFSFCRTIGS